MCVRQFPMSYLAPVRDLCDLNHLILLRIRAARYLSELHILISIVH